VTRLFKNAMLSIALLCSLSLTVGSVATAAQSGSDVDIEDVGDLVLDADVDFLLEDLESPISNSDLPEGFSDATLIDPDDEDAAAGVLDASAYAEVVGSVGYSLTGDTKAFGVLNMTVTAQILVLDPEEEAADYLEVILEGAEDEIAETDLEDTELSAELSSLNGVDTVVITLEQTVKRVSVLVHFMIVPVGNSFVITTVTVADRNDVDVDTVAEANQELSLSIINFLGDTAADAV